MHSQTLARGIAAGAVLVASALVLVARLPDDAPPAGAAGARIDALRIEPVDAVAEADPPLAAPADAQAAAATFRELRAMSETFRNSTFLIAIRDAGYVCNELLRVSGALDDSPKWLATCSETMAYTIGIADNGTLRVQPFLQYFDGIGPRIVEQDFVDPSPQPPMLDRR